MATLKTSGFLFAFFVCLFVLFCLCGGVVVCLLVGVCVWGVWVWVCALVIAHFRGHLCVFYNTTGDSLQPATSPVEETSCPDSPVAKKRKAKKRMRMHYSNRGHNTSVWWCPWMVGNNPFYAAIFVPRLSIKKLKIICVSPLYTQFKKGGCVCVFFLFCFFVLFCFCFVFVFVFFFWFFFFKKSLSPIYSVRVFEWALIWTDWVWKTTACL